MRRRAAAEAIGTFALVFTGCGAVMIDALSGGAIGHAGVAATFGLVVMAVVYAIGHISGAHINPAVTLAFAAIGRFEWKEVPAYLVSQFVAATAAAWSLKILLGPVAMFGATLPSGSMAQALGFELVITFILMFVIVGVATDSRAEGQMAGIAVGGTVALCALFAGPIAGASMNPARSFGPALMAGELSSLWIYFLGPVLGAVAGAWAYRYICCSKEEACGSQSVC